jgi:hypothetical protein
MRRLLGLTGQVAERAGWQIVRAYKDHGISGAESKDKRPETPCTRQPPVASSTW